ncbi:rhomboid family intramembrane serine protease [Methylobacter sp. S3L5C]|uniref:rhomboid family intramembrane serine protease n=1 Tax=Methylobacter sp. S3L5C TaxID=2839024 RepID=UPI001FAD4ACB|nr:rhomboid family intramembrane serine protease [Methylobacter sp. S3L5C]UOA08097.1 rhomboid family intramembrane serine protease [Methylobacter sp. S3L5C]
MIPIRDTAPCYAKPYVTWGIIAVCTSIFIAMKIMPDQAAIALLHRYGMVPIRYSVFQENLPFDGYLSFVTNLFLHASWTHLLMNMWFMWIFGDNVEDRMGRLPFLIFYLLCGVFATLLQWYFDPLLDIPVIGASGAIAGVLAAYFFLYPLERVIVFFPPMLFHVPAIAFLGLWIILQVDNATTSIIFEGVTIGVAWWAHLGGFVAGSILYRVFLKSNKNDVI